MDPERFRQAYSRLEQLEERLSHKIRPRERLTLGPPTQRQLEENLRDLSQYTLDLKDVVRELFLAIAGRPSADPPAAEEEAPE